MHKLVLAICWKLKSQSADRYIFSTEDVRHMMSKRPWLGRIRVTDSQADYLIASIYIKADRVRYVVVGAPEYKLSEFASCFCLADPTSIDQLEAVMRDTIIRWESRSHKNEI